MQHTFLITDGTLVIRKTVESELVFKAENTTHEDSRAMAVSNTDLTDFNVLRRFLHAHYTILLDGEIVGFLTVFGGETDEIGFWIAPLWRGRGLAARAVRLFAGHTRRKLRAGCWTTNEGSRKVLERSGFTYTHTARYGRGEALWFERAVQ